MATADDILVVDGKEVLRFHPLHKKIKDGTLRCVSCGQIDEPDVHEQKFCPGSGGNLPFATSTLKLRLKADNGYSCETTYRIRLEQWALLCKILHDADKVSRVIRDQNGSAVGTDFKAVTELLEVEGFTDDNGTVWFPPTAWAYRQACLALAKPDATPDLHRIASKEARHG